MVPSRPRIPHWVMHIKILIQNTKDTNQMFQTSDKTHLKVQIPQEVWSKESHSVFMKDYHILIENEPKTWLSWSIQSGFLVCGHFFSHGTFLLGRAFFQLTQTDKIHELLKNQHDMILSRWVNGCFLLNHQKLVKRNSFDDSDCQNLFLMQFCVECHSYTTKSCLP